MKTNRIVICLLVLTSFALIQCNVNETKIIQNNTYTIKSVSPVDTVYDDLNFLQYILKNKKIVFLGESGHGDGSTFEAKTRLIKYLHENLGYNVIAFEGATIFDLYYAGAIIKKGGTPQIAAQQLKRGLYFAWSGSQEFREMANYIGQNSKSLTLIGIDNNFAMTGYAHFFPKFLDQIFNISSSSELDYQNFLEQHNLLLTKSFQLTNDSIFNFDKFILDIEIMKVIVGESSKGSLEVKDYFIHELDNLVSFVDEIEMGLEASVIYRDRQMAENLIWAIDNYYPNEKVIIWTANTHAAKNINQAIYAEGDDLYQRFTTLAQHISDEYGANKVFSIACTSVEGEFNSYPDPIPISIPETSWDHKRAQEIKNDFAFIDFIKMRKSEFGNIEFESTILGYQPHQGKWYNIFDGVLFIRKMKPSTFK